MTRLVIELAPGRFVKPTPRIEQAWNAYQRHCLSAPKDEGWEDKRRDLHKHLMQAYEE